MRRRWVEELTNLGYTPPWLTRPTTAPAERPSVGRVDRDAVADLALSRLGARRSAWNGADIRGEVETILTTLDLITPPAVRRELAEDLTARALAACRPLLARDDVPEHVRAWTSPRVLAVEADLTTRLAARAQDPAAAAEPDPIGARVGGRHLDDAQRRVVAALTGTSPLIVIEGAAGAGKTTALAAARDLLEHDGTTTGTGTRFVVVTPTLKAAQVVAGETGAWAYTAAWLIHAHGFRHDDDGHHTRLPLPHPGAGSTPTPACTPGTSWSSTRPGCSTRTPPTPCSPSPMRPAHASRSSATATSCPPWDEAVPSTTPTAGHHPRPGSSSTPCTASPTPTTPP